MKRGCVLSISLSLLAVSALLSGGNGCDGTDDGDRGADETPDSGVGKPGAGNRRQDLPGGGLLRTSSPGRYRSVDVGKPGRVSVTAVYTGERIPARVEVSVDTDKEHCGLTVVAQDVIVDEETRALKNAVVRLEGISAGKPPIREVTVSTRDCMFAPHVAVAMVRSKLTVKNEDPVLHTVRPSLGDDVLFEAPLPNQQAEYPGRPIPRTGLVSIRCDEHSWMQAYVVAHTNPYLGVTDEKGRLILDQVPPGTYPYVAWHEKLGERRGDVTVEGGETVELKLELSPEQ